MSFGIANNVRSEVRECTPDLLNQALDNPQVAKTCAEIEDALEALRRGELTKEEYETRKAELKKRLPIFTFHATFKNGRRKNDDAVPSGLSIYDQDHISNPRAKWAEIEPRKEELGIVLAHITPSSEGLRLVFVIPQGMDLTEAQAWMAKQLGDKEYDACVKDHARCSFAVPREYVLYQSEALFNEELRTKNEELPLDNSHTIVIQTTEGRKNLEDTAQPKVDAPEILRRDAPLDDNKYAETFKGTPYTTIIAEWFRRNGGEPEVGERNSKLHRLASHLRYITDNNEEHLLQILPRYGLKEEEMRALIHSACTAKFYGMPKALQKLLKDLQSDSEPEEEEEESEIINQTSDIDSPPEMPKRLPPLIKLLVSRTPKIYQPAVAHAVFPALGAHLWKTTFRYIDNTLHEATLANVLMAPTGAGKSCICQPLDYILADIRERDKKNMEREKKWKLEMQTKGANKDKKSRPEGIVIQEIDPDVTPAAFVQRLAEAEERFLYLRMNEIELFNNLSPKGNAKGHFQLMCLAFDYNNDYGQTRASATSVCERACVRLNYNISTTIRKGQAYFRSVLTDGPLSRINFSTIPERPIGSEMPVYGTYGADFEEELRPYIERLNEARGLVECKQVTNLTKQLMHENADFARLSQSRVFENFSFRANVIAFLKAMVLYVAHGEKWDKTMEDFVRWSLRYDLWCKMHFFGSAIEAIEHADLPITPRKGPQNLLDLLPNVFTREEAGIMRKNQGIVDGSLKLMLSNWKKRGYIEPYGEKMSLKNIARQQYVKTEKYLKKFASGKG